MLAVARPIGAERPDADIAQARASGECISDAQCLHEADQALIERRQVSVAAKRV